MSHSIKNSLFNRDLEQGVQAMLRTQAKNREKSQQTNTKSSKISKTNEIFQNSQQTRAGNQKPTQEVTFTAKAKKQNNSSNSKLKNDKRTEKPKSNVGSKPENKQTNNAKKPTKKTTSKNYCPGKQSEATEETKTDSSYSSVGGEKYSTAVNSPKHSSSSTYSFTPGHREFFSSTVPAAPFGTFFTSAETRPNTSYSNVGTGKYSTTPDAPKYSSSSTASFGTSFTETKPNTSYSNVGGGKYSTAPDSPKHLSSSTASFGTSFTSEDTRPLSPLSLNTTTSESISDPDYESLDEEEFDEIPTIPFSSSPSHSSTSFIIAPNFIPLTLLDSDYFDDSDEEKTDIVTSPPFSNVSKAQTSSLGSKKEAWTISAPIDSDPITAFLQAPELKHKYLELKVDEILKATESLRDIARNLGELYYVKFCIEDDHKGAYNSLIQTLAGRNRKLHDANSYLYDDLENPIEKRLVALLDPKHIDTEKLKNIVVGEKDVKTLNDQINKYTKFFNQLKYVQDLRENFSIQMRKELTTEDVIFRLKEALKKECFRATFCLDPTSHDRFRKFSSLMNRRLGNQEELNEKRLEFLLNDLRNNQEGERLQDILDPSKLNTKKLENIISGDPREKAAADEHFKNYREIYNALVEFQDLVG